MYATLAFAITLLGVFSIFELLKGNQKISLLKFHFIARLILLTGNCTNKIAELLNIKCNTVSTIKKSIFNKTKTTNLIELYEVYK
ncbi:MAG: helix-turn-helix transcriptional regulator [Sediminibacterium sp.]